MDGNKETKPVSRQELEQDINDVMKQTLLDLESIKVVNPVRHTVRQAFRGLKRDLIQKLKMRGYDD